MSVDCPVDSTHIEWGIVSPAEELEMRSMELAVEAGRIDIVKQLRTVEYPFTCETFEAAIKTGDIDMLKYLKEEAVEHCENPYQHRLQLLEKYGWQLREEVIDNALRDHNICLAKYLVDTYDVKPSPRAYRFVLARDAQDEWFIDVLNWLHDDVLVRKLKSDSEHELLENTVRSKSPWVQMWFDHNGI